MIIQELSTALSIHREIKILYPGTGMEWTRSKSLLKYNFDSAVSRLENISREK